MMSWEPLKNFREEKCHGQVRFLEHLGGSVGAGWERREKIN